LSKLLVNSLGGTGDDGIGERLNAKVGRRGLIASDDDMRPVLFPRLKSQLPQRAVIENFGAYEGQPSPSPRTQSCRRWNSLQNTA
jgi:hypothetical protein